MSLSIATIYALRQLHTVLKIQAMKRAWGLLAPDKYNLVACLDGIGINQKKDGERHDIDVEGCQIQASAVNRPGKCLRYFVCVDLLDLPIVTCTGILKTKLKRPTARCPKAENEIQQHRLMARPRVERVVLRNTSMSLCKCGATATEPSNQYGTLWWVAWSGQGYLSN
ncbi:hypothetical protein DFH06DRAFT_344346 [Mycena polygramma]|nr:hypothetical protein DFH06DRAFT_344346 [Mycena polygramma]